MKEALLIGLGVLVTVYGCMRLVASDPDELARDRHRQTVEAAYRHGELH